MNPTIADKQCINHRFGRVLNSTEGSRKQVWHSTAFPPASRPIRRLQRGIESLSDNLEFAQWLLALCLRGMFLLIACRLRNLAMRSIHLIFKP
jgi:hypothetical protein